MVPKANCRTTGQRMTTATEADSEDIGEGLDTDVDVPHVHADRDQISSQTLLVNNSAVCE